MMKAWIIVALLVAGMAATADAATYPGWSDTGWSYYDKSDCCADAIAEAQDDGMFRCEKVGGFPRLSQSARRGSCKWRWQVDSYGDRVYRCWSTVQVNCR